MDGPPPALVMSQQQNQPVPTTMHLTPLLSPVEHAPPPPTFSGAPIQPPLQAPPVTSTLHTTHQPAPTAFPQPVEQVTPVQPVDPAGPPPEPLFVPVQPLLSPSEPPIQPVEPVSEPLVSPPINAHPIPEPTPLFSQNDVSEHPPDRMEESLAQDGGQIPASESIESVEMDEGDNGREEVGGGMLDEGEEKKESNDDDMQLDSPSANEEENVAETTEPNQT